MSICTIPWNHIAVLQNGDYGICCQCIYNSHGRLITNDKSENIETDIDSIRNHPTYIELRKSMLAGEKHSLCKLCWDEEQYGKKSKRLSQNEIYTNLLKKIEEDENKSGIIDTNKYPITYIDLRLGNLCNLACRMCGPVNSSLWQDYMDGGSFEAGETKYNIIKVGASWRIDSDDFQFYKKDSFKKLLEKILPTTDRIYFTGGEPLINKWHYDILDNCIEHGISKNISLEYNTNGTTLNENLLNQWKNFKKVEVCFSLDGIGIVSDYIRYPSNWKNIEKNLQLFSNSKLTNIIGTVNFTISIYNVMHFPDFLKWYHEKRLKNFKLNLVWNRLVFPSCLNIQNLPLFAKEDISNYYKNFISKNNIRNIESLNIVMNFMNEASPDNKEFFKSYLFTKRQDKHRNQLIRDFIPWLDETYEKFNSNFLI